MHSQDAGTQNVDAVNLLIADDAYGPCRRLVLDDVAQGIALLFAELLGVVQQVVAEVGRQDDGCGKDGSCQAAASGLVAAGLDDAVMVKRL